MICAYDDISLHLPIAVHPLRSVIMLGMGDMVENKVVIII